jgi:hypothetical protein
MQGEATAERPVLACPSPATPDELSLFRVDSGGGYVKAFDTAFWGLGLAWLV